MTTKPSPMDRALALARQAANSGEVPVGAVIVDASGRVIAEAANAMRGTTDPTAHAEMTAIRAACETMGSERLTDCDLYVTLEPCPMCAAAISAARLRRVYYGASDPKSGGIEQGPRVFAHPQSHHVPDVYAGIGEAAAAELLKEFFAKRR